MGRSIECGKEDEGGQNFHFDLNALHNVVVVVLGGCGLKRGDHELIQICTFALEATWNSVSTLALQWTLS